MLGFTGTRSGVTQPQADALCKALFYYSRFFEFMHNGDCIGADEYAARYWTSCGGKLWLHPPRATAYRANLSAAIVAKPLPYLQRNLAIVLEATVMLACPGEEHEKLRSGTLATIRYAREAGRELHIIFPSGRVQGERPT